MSGETDIWGKLTGILRQPQVNARVLVTASTNMIDYIDKHFLQCALKEYNLCGAIKISKLFVLMSFALSKIVTHFSSSLSY